uniref:Uncharacterized protein n=1 Tax=Mola mola TaxID=94237 RepID=A0A3Q3WJ18_MOLML
MSGSSFLSPRQSPNDDALELDGDLERMIENMELCSVHLTLMAYDMVVLRTSPDLLDSVLELVEAFERCRFAVCGGPDQEPDPEHTRADQ